MAKLDPSNMNTLFNSLGSNNAFGSVNLSDYAAIKNGSYGKLLKAYYAEQKTGSVGKDTENKRPVDKKEQEIDSTGLAQLKKDADRLKEAASALSDGDLWKQTNGEYAKDKIVSAVKDFAEGYNEVVSQSAKVSAKDVAQSVHYMNSLSKTLSKSLEKIGISIGTDGKMSVDEKTLSDSKISTVKSLLSGSNSYGGQIVDKAAEISKAAIMNNGLYKGDGSVSSTLAGLFNQYI